MQLPSLFIRGAIATQTMSNLPDEDITKVNEIVKTIENDPCLAGDKHEFIRQLGATIKGDYRSDPNAALQEFRIAIWRATVHLLFHHDYNYNCSICGATSYLTCSGKNKSFDRQFKICPHCKQSYFKIGNNLIIVNITKQGDSVDIINNNTIIASFKDKTTAEISLQSPISTIPGTKKIDDPQKILQDHIQRGKWYTVWIWNYFRQILNENIIKTHNKHQIDVSGNADYVAFQLIANELRRRKCKFSYDEGKISSGADDININVDIMHIEPSFSGWLEILSKEYLGHNVSIIYERTHPNTWANILTIKRIGITGTTTATIETEDPVVVLSFGGPSNNDESDGSSTWGDTIEFNSEAQIYDGEIGKFESDEAMSIVRKHLHDQNARMTFDILSQTGEVWIKFSTQWGTQPARKAHIAEFLHVTTKQVDIYKQMIMTQCLVHDLKAGRKSIINNRTIGQQMKSAEDEVCRDIKGDIINICVLYRYMCMAIAKCNTVLSYTQLPIRLRDKINTEQYKTIASRVHRFVR